MQLNHFVDYSFRTLIYVAVNEGKRSTLTQVSDQFSISKEHLRKVVHRLAQLGYLETYKGKHGGFELSRDAGLINLGELFEELEEQRKVIDCDHLNCLLNPACNLKSVFYRAQKAFIDTLAEFTLADVVDNDSTRAMLIAKV